MSDIPKGSVVSASEWLWPALVDRGGLTLDFLPYGIDVDPYVILTYARMPDASYQLQVTSFQPEAEKVKIRARVQAKVDRSYKSIKETEFGGIKVTSYQRT